MDLTFFGVRGSCPCAGEEYGRVGGNTSCTLVSVDEEPLLVLDLGSGMRALGERLARAGTPLHMHALLTHLHFDHLLGLPFFAPLLEPGAQLRLFGPEQDGKHLRDALACAMRPPFFPVSMFDLGGEVEVEELSGEGPGGVALALGGIAVRAARVPHPGPTLGFRLSANAKTAVYIPDHQAPPDRKTIPEQVQALCEGADVLVHDAQYTEAEYAMKPTWGHSTAAYAIRVAVESGVARLVLFHHDPSHTDRDLDELLADARRHPDARKLDEVSVAIEGATVRV
jgi:ribonuclease BN (tRNA processing enzyme)